MKTSVKEKTGTCQPEWDIGTIEGLIIELNEILSSMVQLEIKLEPLINEIHPSYRDSARNLIHYIAFRQRDNRQLQEKLALLGISSLGRAESHVMNNIHSILKILYNIDQSSLKNICENNAFISYSDGRALMDLHSDYLFGKPPAGRTSRIMVTMPSNAAESYELVRSLLENGMDCMRINCAYDNAETWDKMIKNLRRAETELGKKCKIFMDLAGHKIRTGPVEPLTPVVKWRPKKDRMGRMIAPARVWISPTESINKKIKGSFIEPKDATIHVPEAWISRTQVGDRIIFKDNRDKRRVLEIVAVAGEHRIAECDRSTYVSPGIVFHVDAGPGNISPPDDIALKDFPGEENQQFIQLEKGDILVLSSEMKPGHSAKYDDNGKLIEPATVSVTLPEIFQRVKPGERVWLDDGKIGGIIRSVEKDRMTIEVTAARPQGEKLRANKGINLPDSELNLPALTSKDVEDLYFVAKNADVVGFSFVCDDMDVYELQERLMELGGMHLGIVLKIETLQAFEHLPNLLIAAMRSPCAGLMIARGDLAVECGFERLAEVQEEILWFCEAAHMPVIWATQVLENLAKKGQPSRAEITDAAMGVRAECVMLNKGPYIVDAVIALDDILKRMQVHQKKKSPMLRKLSLAGRFQV